jgi:6-phosphogluconolactonase (cycloisomerase 2 family)
MSDDGRTLYAVNSGSDSVSSFRVTQHGLALIGRARSGGIAPVSVDEYHGRVYVVNSGDTPSRGRPNVTEFVAPLGHLVPVPGGTRELAPGAAGIAQVSVAPGGGRLVVTERDANRIETLSLDVLGRPRPPVATASAGATPFGFAFGSHGELIVSEAGASTVSSYRVGLFGGLSPITRALSVGQGAACWVAVSPDGRFAYTGNAAGSISGFAVDRGGALTPLDADGLTASLPEPFTPRDLAFDRSGRVLYDVSPGGQVAGFRVGRDGSLQQFTTAPASAGLTGIAVS